MDYESLCRMYFLNRHHMKGVELKIKKFLTPIWENNLDVDMEPIRSAFWEYFSDEYNGEFPGWVEMCERVKKDIDNVYDEQFILGELLDQKRKLRKELSSIKRKIYYAGKRSIRGK